MAYPPSIVEGIEKIQAYFDARGAVDGIGSIDYMVDGELTVLVVLNGIIVDTVTEAEVDAGNVDACEWIEGIAGGSEPFVIPLRARRRVWEATEGRMCKEQGWAMNITRILGES